MMILLVDIGNQRLKWRLDDAGQVVAGGAFPVAGEDRENDLEEALNAGWGGLPHPHAAWISCVAGGPVREGVARWLREHRGLEPVWARASRAAAGVANGYREPGALGSDRWAALVGARSLQTERPAVVVDCGTAITVDAMDETGRFLGGVILPGPALMAAALQRGTVEISLPETPETEGWMVEEIDPFGRTTRDAVTGGVLCAAAGGIQRALELQAGQLAGEPVRFLTGGDAPRLLGLLAGDFWLAPDLVLDGLAVLAETGGGAGA